MKYFYFAILMECGLGESSQRAHETSASSIFLSETAGRLTEPSRLSRDLLILGFCCNPNHNSLISCYHVCELMCPRCSGCQKNPQTNSCWEWWPIPSAAKLPFLGKASRAAQPGENTAAPGCLSPPRAFCNIYLPSTWAPRVPALPGTHTGAHSGGAHGRGLIWESNPPKNTGAAELASSAFLKITSYVREKLLPSFGIRSPLKTSFAIAAHKKPLFFFFFLGNTFPRGISSCSQGSGEQSGAAPVSTDPEP